MKHKLFFIALLILTTISFSQINTPADEAPFTVSAKSTFSLSWRGRPIITEDELDAIPADPLKNPEGYRSQTIENKTVQNTWKVTDPYHQVTYRREVASDEKSVEVTTQFRVPAYYFDDKPKNLQSFYYLRIPLKVLDGMKYQAVVRQAGKIKTVTGIISSGTAPDIAGQTIYITFTDQTGHHLSFDFGPSGATSFDKNTSATSLPESWWSGADKNEMRFSIGRLPASTYPYNGVYNGKVIIDESTFAEYQKRHAHHIYNYYMELPPIHQFSFGAGELASKWRETDYQEIPESVALARENDRWIPAKNQIYSQTNGFGWQDISHIELQGDVAKGVLHGLAKSTFPGDFRVDVQQPGIYIFTIRAAAQENSIGPFAITCNNEIAAQDITLNPQEIKTVTFSRYIKNGQADIHFSGNWAVSSIAVQMLINQSEDFTFDRGLWLAQNIPTPTTLFQIQRRPVPAAGAMQSYSTKVLSSPKTAKINVDDNQQIDFKTDNPATAWRWESNITALGPGNKGSFYEFETDAQISRRLDELKKLGYTTILLNGMLIRHAYPEEQQHVQEVVTRIAALAHQRGMKVMDHFDVTVIPNLDGAFQLMLEHIDWTLRDVRNGQVTRGFCINNPHFQKYFYQRMKDYVRATHIDGIMLDEITFQKSLYCGCEYCREKFHQDTGLTLPVDENSPDLLNPQSRLWRQWQLWRAKAQADFCVGLMKQIKQVNPNFVWMKYGAPSVFLKPRMIDGGARLSDASRFSNFLGIESLTNNVYATHRSELAIGNIFNSITAAEHIPGFELVYDNHQPIFAYAGWAINNMVAHRSWSVQGDQAIEADAKRYLNWKDNMNLRRAEQVADVAVLLSRSTRDFSPQAATYIEKITGMCEQLGDLHVPYQVLLDRDLNLDNLQKYHLLILPNDSALSDAELDVIHQYIETGGRVLATGETAMQDEFGFSRKEWPLGKWLGISAQDQTKKGSILEGELTENKPLQYADPIVIATAEKGITPKVLLQAQYDDKASIAVTEKQIGKGSLMWSAAALGAINYSPYARVGDAWKYQPDDAVLNLLNDLVMRERGKNPPFQAVQIPTSVLMTIYRQKEDSGKMTTFVHLYNGSGVTLQKGDKIPTAAPKDAFPQLAKDIIFDIDLPEKSTFTADFVSPDFAGSRKVSLESLGNSRYRITLPAAELGAYGMVRIQ